MEYTKDQMLALFNRRLEIELDVNTQVNVRLLDSAAPPRCWEIQGRRVSLEWTGRDGWAVGDRRTDGRFTFLYKGYDYAAAVTAFEAAIS